METHEPEWEQGIDQEGSGAGRARRAGSLMAGAVVVLGVVVAAYLHPSLGAWPAPGRVAGAPVQGSPMPVASAAPPSYRIAAMDFISATTGWVVAVLDGGYFEILRTGNGGDSWSRELTGPTSGPAPYIKFFDRKTGYFALTGAHPILFRTTDGGTTWAGQATLRPGSVALSWSFVDPGDGWLLARTGGTTRLYRTPDGGDTWVDLGEPVKAPDQAFRVQFASRADGWIDSLSAGPYAYRSTDLGATWDRIALAPPQGGWPRSGQFLVAAQPTVRAGVVATVVNFAPATGRAGVGGTILVYPPLTVRAFDGGVPVTYTYGVSMDSMAGAGMVDSNAVPRVEVPAQVELGSLDGGTTWSTLSMPSPGGAVGYADASHWWWIGQGTWSRSTDAGATWSPMRNIGVPEALPGSLEVLDGETAWFAAVAGGRPLLETTSDGGVHWEMVLMPPLDGSLTP